MDKALSRDVTLIAYRRQGDAPPVILVGGVLGTAATEAREQRLDQGETDQTDLRHCQQW
ncbi:hypothetical protein [Streptomyces sp. NPDC051286]|uniref:hypothetical protein n=1 Tax=Streptomyces sp. NPDC051286 TaxID=3365647 RepID=UPI00379602FE